MLIATCITFPSMCLDEMITKKCTITNILDPGAPTLNDPTLVEDTSFAFSWVEPNIKNGELLNYSITIQSNGPQYLVPSSEECDIDLNVYNYEVSADTTSFIFSEALPYYTYSVFIRASTSVGYGPASDTSVIITAEAGTVIAILNY